MRLQPWKLNSVFFAEENREEKHLNDFYGEISSSTLFNGVATVMNSNHQRSFQQQQKVKRIIKRFIKTKNCLTPEQFSAI